MRSRAARFRWLLVAAVLCVPGIRAAAGQDQRAEANRALQFGANVDLVLVDLTVTDSDGRFVHGLTARDFRVFEEGEEMEITFFALEKFAPPEAKADEPEVDGLATLNRYIVVYVDGINTTPQNWLRLRPHLRRWLEEGRQENDHVLLACLHPDGHLRMTPEFTRDTEMLVDALMQVEGNPNLAFRISRQERELAQALGLEELNRQAVDVAADAARLRQGAQLAATFESQRRQEVRLALDYLNGLADHLGTVFQVPGPKIVVMISGGLPEIPGLNFRLMVDQQASEISPLIRQLAGLSNFQPLVPERSSTRGAQLELQHAIGRFNRANYLFYTIDARGLGDSQSGDARYPIGSNLSSTSRATVTNNEQRGLVRIAAGTGGLAFYNSVDFERALERVQQDTAYRYVLGYARPEHDPLEVDAGKFYRVEVETRVPGVTVRAREGYIDDSGI